MNETDVLESYFFDSSGDSETVEEIEQTDSVESNSSYETQAEETEEVEETELSGEYMEILEEMTALQEQQLVALNHVYTFQLFSIGVLGAVLVCLVLYKLLKIFL